MKSGSAKELLRAVETVAGGETYISPTITKLAVQQFGRHGGFRAGLASLTDREIAVFLLIAAEHGVGRIAEEFGISRKTVESHCEHIKSKLGYPDADTLKRGARELLGAGTLQAGTASSKATPK
jgi:DNA-binding NarL/FixJ family response regulator